MKIYVGNLSFDVSESELRAAFEPFGPVESVSLAKDKATGNPRGFAFIEMPDRATAGAAIAGLTGTELRGRTLTVSEARAPSEGYRREDRPRGRAY